MTAPLPTLRRAAHPYPKGTMTKVHRRLAVTTPYAKGPDVRALQSQINDNFRKFRIGRRVKEDGEFGPATLSAARQVAFLLGVVGKARRRSKSGIISQKTQKLIRGRRRFKRERLAAIARRPYRQELRKRYDRSGGKRAVKIAKSQIGVTENPPGSNWGPKVSEYIKFTGYTFPVYWCGCFVAWCVVNAGAKIPTRIRLGYTGYITADANAGVNGLTAVPFDDARAGDIAVFSFDHIALVDRRDGDLLYTVEGNTSAGSSGSQSNGGVVFARVRSRSDVVTIARPSY